MVGVRDSEEVKTELREGVALRDPVWLPLALAAEALRERVESVGLRVSRGLPLGVGLALPDEEAVGVLVGVVDPLDVNIPERLGELVGLAGDRVPVGEGLGVGLRVRVAPCDRDHDRDLVPVWGSDGVAVQLGLQVTDLVDRLALAHEAVRDGEAVLVTPGDGEGVRVAVGDCVVLQVEVRLALPLPLPDGLRVRVTDEADRVFPDAEAVRHTDAVPVAVEVALSVRVPEGSSDAETLGVSARLAVAVAVPDGRVTDSGRVPEAVGVGDGVQVAVGPEGDAVHARDRVAVRVRGRVLEAVGVAVREGLRDAVAERVTLRNRVAVKVEAVGLSALVTLVLAVRLPLGDDEADSFSDRLGEALSVCRAVGVAVADRVIRGLVLVVGVRDGDVMVRDGVEVGLGLLECVGRNESVGVRDRVVLAETLARSDAVGVVVRLRDSCSVCVAVPVGDSDQVHVEVGVGVREGGDGTGVADLVRETVSTRVMVVAEAVWVRED